MGVKAQTFITLEDVADWLKIGLAKFGQASKAIAGLTYTSLPGYNGNLLQVAYTGGGTKGSEVVTVSGMLVSVQIEDGVSNATDVWTKLTGNAQFMALADVDVTGAGTTLQAVMAPTALTGADFDARLTRVMERLINSACDGVERFIDGPVLTREFQEDHDGSNSNVLIPRFTPVRSITSLRVDYNRNFAADTELLANEFFIRAAADVRQAAGDVVLKIIGTDVVLFDDNENMVVGRIFPGSVLGAIRLKYKAGWGDTPSEIPDQLSLATIQLVEYWWYQRENRDLGVRGKGVKGESYTRLSDDIPPQIASQLQPYKNMGFGGAPVPQRNVFKT